MSVSIKETINIENSVNIVNDNLVIQFENKNFTIFPNLEQKIEDSLPYPDYPIELFNKKYLSVPICVESNLTPESIYSIWQFFRITEGYKIHSYQPYYLKEFEEIYPVINYYIKENEFIKNYQETWNPILSYCMENIIKNDCVVKFVSRNNGIIICKFPTNKKKFIFTFIGCNANDLPDNLWLIFCEKVE